MKKIIRQIDYDWKTESSVMRFTDEDAFKIALEKEILKVTKEFLNVVPEDDVDNCYLSEESDSEFGFDYQDENGFIQSYWVKIVEVA